MANLLCDNVRPDGNGFTMLHQLRVDGTTILEGAGGVIYAAIGPMGGLRSDRFTPIEGQTHFVLSAPPGPVVMAFLNGFLQRLDQDYVLSGQTVIWLNTEFELGSTDDLEVFY